MGERSQPIRFFASSAASCWNDWDDEITTRLKAPPKTLRFPKRKFAEAPKGRRAVMRSPQAEQGEGSAPALTDLVTAEAGASPSERQRKERPQTRLMRC